MICFVLTTVITRLCGSRCLASVPPFTHFVKRFCLFLGWENGLKWLMFYDIGLVVVVLWQAAISFSLEKLVCYRVFRHVGYDSYAKAHERLFVAFTPHSRVGLQMESWLRHEYTAQLYNKV